MVPGVPRRVDEFELATPKAQAQAIPRLDHARFVDRRDLSVHAHQRFGAVDGFGAGDQFRRIDHVPRTPRVHHHLRFGQGAHQHAGTAGVVQVHMGGQYVAHPLRGDAARLQQRKQARHTMRGTRFDEGVLAVALDQIAAGQPAPLLEGVDAQNSMVQYFDWRDCRRRLRVHPRCSLHRRFPRRRLAPTTRQRCAVDRNDSKDSGVAALRG